MNDDYLSLALNLNKGANRTYLSLTEEALAS